MNDVAELKKRFSLRGVTIEAGRGGLPRVVVATPEADAHIYLHGAHVTHFQPQGGREMLFVSVQSLFEAGKPIRGGVPIIFPWFGPRAKDPASPMHGFARTQEWDLADIRRGTDGSIAVVLELHTSAASKKLWPHDFRLRYIVTVGAVLDLVLEVTNASPVAFSFEEALHTYLSVGDVRRVEVTGLAGADFLDKTDGQKRKTQPPGPISIIGETDRVYLNTTDAVTATDPALSRQLTVDKFGSQSTVLWNPWIAKAKAMADFGDEEWPHMLCIETVNAAENALALKPGDTHRLRAIISASNDDGQFTRAQWEMDQGSVSHF